MRGTTAPFAHVDGWAGQTPNEEIIAIRSLYLLRSPEDPNPVRVFDHGTSPVEVELVSGKETEIASVALKTLPAGVFALAKAGVAYVRYSVDARMHSVVSVDGRYENVQALSDDAVIDGVSRAKGYFRYSFVASGTALGTLEGADAPVPATVATGGISMDASGPETFYVFPVQIAIDPNVGSHWQVTFEVNVHESFRWQDVSAAKYTAGVFDTTPSTFEPVMAFGANAFSLTMAAKP